MEKCKIILIRPEVSMKSALKQMDEVGYKTLFVADDNNILMGTVTDGDIRRWILKGRNLNKSVRLAMNRRPVYLKEGYSKEDAKNRMVSRMLECIPIIDAKKKIISAVWWVDLFETRIKKRRLKNTPVVIMAGGEGTRLSPFTYILPKPLVPIGDKPIIELIINKFVEFGCKDFYLSLNYKAKIIKAYFSDLEHNYNVHYIQEDKPLGTIGSLYLLKKNLKNAFFVTNCDILIEADYADIFKFHKEKKNDITLVVSMKHYKIPYGICEINNGGVLRGIKEKPEYDFLANTGLYLLERNVLTDIPDNTFYNITDLMDGYIKKDKKIGIYPVSEKSWMDMGQWEEMQEMMKKCGVKIE